MNGNEPGTAAAWYTNPVRNRAPKRRSGAFQRSPRAFDARGLGSVHHVLVQLADVGLRPRFAEACKAFGDIVWCDDLEELVRRASEREALAVVVDVIDRHGHPTAAAVSAARRERPDLPIVVWADREAAVIPLTHLAAAGASAIIFRDESDLESRLLGSLTRASDMAFHQLTDQALFRRVPDPLVPAVRFCLDHPALPLRPELVARALGIGARALSSQLRRAGLPPIGVIATWSKALTAAYRLEHGTESPAAIARSVGFSSPAAMTRVLRRCANDSATALREPGGFGWVLRCFERYLAKGRRDTK